MTLTPNGQINRAGRVIFGDASLGAWEDTMPPLSGIDAHLCDSCLHDVEKGFDEVLRSKAEQRKANKGATK